MRERGFCVALLGPDGAGKTTIAQALIAEVGDSAHYLYSGLSPAVHPLDWLRGFPGGGRLLRFTRVLLMGVRARLLRRRGHLVVLDRAPQEFLLDSTHRGRALGLRLWALRMLAPEPDLAILLDAPGEVLFARKGEHSVEILDRMRAGYRELLPGMRASAIVDVRADPDTVLRAVVATIESHWRGAAAPPDQNTATAAS